MTKWRLSSMQSMQDYRFALKWVQILHICIPRLLTKSSNDKVGGS
ncbi:hypothetical protein [Helicobacter rodentium]|nr:hypothetical protein [Helicobacter rodentium]